MALNSLGLGFIFRARDFASPTMQKIEGRFKKLDATTEVGAQRMQRAIGGVVVGLGVAAVGAGVLATSFNLASAAGNFGQQLAAVGQITGATESEMSKLRDTALDVGLRTKFSPDQIVEGLKNMGAAGLKAKEAMKAIEPAALLATAGQIELADASNAVVGTIRSFGLEVKDAGSITDKLTRSMQLSNIQGQDFQAGISKAGAVMGGFGQTLDTTLVLFGALRNANIDASSSGTALRESIRRLASDAGAQNTVTKQGVDIYDKQTGKMRDMGQVMFDLIDKTKSLSVEDRNRIAVQAFGARGILAFNAATKLTTKTMRNGVEVTLSQRDAYEELMNQTAGASGAAETFNDKLLDTFQGQKEILEGARQTLRVVLGEGFAKVLKPLVQLVAETVGGMAKFFRGLPMPLKKAISAFILIAGAMVTVTGLIIAGGAAFVLIKMALIAFAPVLLIAAKAILIVGAAITALVGLLALLKFAVDENIGGFGDTMKKTFGKVKLFFQGIFQLMSGNKLKGNVLKKLIDPANKGVLRMVQVFQQARFRVKAFFKGLKDGFLGILRTADPTFARLKEAFSAVAEALGFGTEAMDLLTLSSGNFTDAGSDIGEIFGRVVLFAIDILTAGIHILVGVIEGAKIAWILLKPVVLLAAAVFMLMFKAVNWVLGALGLVTGQATEGESAFSLLGKSVGFLVTAFIAVRSVMLLAKAAMIAYRTIAGVVTAVQWILAASGTAASAAMLPILAILGALAVGFALGTLIDEWLGWSDAISGVNKHLRMTEEELNKINLTKKRGANFAKLEEAAKKRNLSVSKFLDVRSGEIAKESTSKRLGLSQEVIRERLEAGQDVFTGGGKEKLATSGISARKDGQLEDSSGKQTDQKNAFLGAMAEHSQKQRSVKGGKTEIVLKVGEEEIAKAVAKGKAALEGLDWEAASVGTGT